MSLNTEVRQRLTLAIHTISRVLARTSKGKALLKNLKFDVATLLVALSEEDSSHPILNQVLEEGKQRDREHRKQRKRRHPVLTPAEGITPSALRAIMPSLPQAKDQASSSTSSHHRRHRRKRRSHRPKPDPSQPHPSNIPPTHISSRTHPPQSLNSTPSPPASTAAPPEHPHHHRNTPNPHSAPPEYRMTGANPDASPSTLPRAPSTDSLVTRERRPRLKAPAFSFRKGLSRYIREVAAYEVAVQARKARHERRRKRRERRKVKDGKVEGEGKEGDGEEEEVGLEADVPPGMSATEYWTAVERAKEEQEEERRERRERHVVPPDGPVLQRGDSDLAFGDDEDSLRDVVGSLRNLGMRDRGRGVRPDSGNTTMTNLALPGHDGRPQVTKEQQKAFFGLTGGNMSFT